MISLRWSSLVVFLVSGCATSGGIQGTWATVGTPEVMVSSPELTLKSGERLDLSQIPPDSAVGTKLRKMSPDCFNWSAQSWKTMFKYAPATFSVRVKVPSMPEPLYGVLTLCRYPPGTAAADAGYNIQVPQKFVDETSDGRVSVVFDYVSAGNYAGRQILWGLWLSRTPLQP